MLMTCWRYQELTKAAEAHRKELEAAQEVRANQSRERCFLAAPVRRPHEQVHAWLSLPGSRPCVRDLFLTNNGSTEIRRQGQRSGGVHQEEHSARE
jgi:hypothetical protein